MTPVIAVREYRALDEAALIGLIGELQDVEGRWFDRMRNCCYECGAAVSERERAEFEQALEQFQADRGGPGPGIV